MNLTKDTAKVFCHIYALYLERIKNGVSRSEAIAFESNFYLSIDKLKECRASDIDFAIQELEKSCLVNRNILDDFKITTDGIIALESKFPNGIKDVAKLLNEITSGVITFVSFITSIVN